MKEDRAATANKHKENKASPQLSAADTAVLRCNNKKSKKFQFPDRLQGVKTTFQDEQKI